MPVDHYAQPQQPSPRMAPPPPVRRGGGGMPGWLIALLAFIIVPGIAAGAVYVWQQAEQSSLTSDLAQAQEDASFASGEAMRLQSELDAAKQELASMQAMQDQLMEASEDRLLPFSFVVPQGMRISNLSRGLNPFDESGNTLTATAILQNDGPLADELTDRPYIRIQSPLFEGGYEYLQGSTREVAHDIDGQSETVSITDSGDALESPIVAYSVIFERNGITYQARGEFPLTEQATYEPLYFSFLDSLAF